jgi:hypothetical protein
MGNPVEGLARWLRDSSLFWDLRSVYGAIDGTLSRFTRIEISQVYSHYSSGYKVLEVCMYGNEASPIALILLLASLMLGDPVLHCVVVIAQRKRSWCFVTRYSVFE